MWNVEVVVLDTKNSLILIGNWQQAHGTTEARKPMKTFTLNDKEWEYIFNLILRESAMWDARLKNCKVEDFGHNRKRVKMLKNIKKKLVYGQQHRKGLKK